MLNKEGYFTEQEPRSLSIADIFPGQGVQGAGMAGDLYTHPAAREIFKQADEALGFNLSNIILNGSDHELRPTEVAQPAILTVSVAALAVYNAENEESNLAPKAVAGHSVGTYAALVRAKSLDFPDAVWLSRRRAESMVNSAQDREAGVMVAILSRSPLDERTLQEICEEEGVDLANLNSDNQIIISGKAVEVERVSSRFAKNGVVAKPLKTSDGFHSRLIGGVEEFRRDVEEVSFYDPQVDFYLNSRGKIVNSGSEIQKELADEMVRSVMWRDTMRNMNLSGITAYREFGSGQVLAGLAKANNPEAKVVNIGDIATAKTARL